MIQKLKNALMAVLLPISMAVPAAIVVPATTFAALGDCSGSYTQSLNQGVNTATNGNAGDCTTPGSGTNANLASLAKKIVNILSVIVGVVAVIMIIVGGFRYITSGGESSNVSSAKNTLIYAIVGLIIVALAQFIVRFVLTNASGATTGIE